ncbi:MAG: xanthine dehydrogenase molybdenum-binding subunit XdhA [Planctomycetota bacterium]
MLFGKIKFSEHAHARIAHIDTSRAERLPGVRAVITGYDTPEIRIGFLKDNFALKRDKVRQFRDEVAAVAAIDPDIAREAVDLIRVEYEPLPAVFDPEQALSPGAPLVHEFDARGRRLESNLVPMPCTHHTGDVDAAMAGSRFVVEGEYSTPRIQQCCMGTAGCIAEFDSRGNLTIWAKTQIPFLAQRDYRNALAAMGLSGNARVIVPAMGGGFGTGLDTHTYEYIAILLAHRTGQPVKIVYSRQEEFAYLSPRQCARTRIRQGCDENGRLTFRDVQVLQDNGAYVSWGATYPTVMLLPVTSLYRVPNVRFASTIVYTNNTYCQAMRGYGNPEVTWAIESSLDDLAAEASIDPLDLRILNCNEPGERTPMGLQVTTCGLRECLERTAAGLDWRAKRGKRRNLRRGVGMASLIHTGGGGRIYRSDGTGMILKLDDFGNVDVLHGGVEMGQGLHSAIALSIAETLGVRPERVHINQTDTGTCPWDVGTHASRGAFMACNAAIRASEAARARIFELARDLFADLASANLRKYRERHPGYEPPSFDVEAASKSGTFTLRDGVLRLEGAPLEPWLEVDLGQILRAAHFRPQGRMLTVEVFYDPPNELPEWSQGKGNLSATYAYGTQGVEVEVDTETGEVRILKMVAAHDVGKALNPTALRGQIYGGLAQGIGYALYEELLSKGGRILNPGFTDYKIPTAHEMGFPIQVEIIETGDREGPFGAKGVGEPGLVPTAPAISNAIFDAIGVRITDLPITPEKILAALVEKAARDA